MSYSKQIQHRSAKCNILDLSDCVLHLIFSYLKAYDIYCISKTCRRFKYLADARSLWKHIDLRDHAICGNKFSFFREHLSTLTRSLLVTGLHRLYLLCEAPLLKNVFVNCCNLSVLALEDQRFDGDKVLLRDFPISLVEISLRHTKLKGSQEFLRGISDRLVSLHTLILDECVWVREHNLMPISKLPNLVNLSLRGCRNMFDSIAYMSLTTRLGFPKLRRIDIRNCENGDEFLKSFRYVRTLREIYMERSAASSADPRFRNMPQSFISMANEAHPDGQMSPITVFSRVAIHKEWTNKRRKLRRERRKEDRRNIDMDSITTRDCLGKCLECTIANCVTNKKILENYLQKQKAARADGVKNAAPSSAKQKDTDLPVELGICDLLPEEDDSGDEDVKDFDYIQSTVTDFGVNIFCTSVNGEENVQDVAVEGEDVESVLFPNVYLDCLCEVKHPGGVTRYRDLDKPGSSGLNQKPFPAETPKYDSSSSDDDDDDNDKKDNGRVAKYKGRSLSMDITQQILAGPSNNNADKNYKKQDDNSDDKKYGDGNKCVGKTTAGLLGKEVVAELRTEVRPTEMKRRSAKRLCDDVTKTTDGQTASKKPKNTKDLSATVTSSAAPPEFPTPSMHPKFCNCRKRIEATLFQVNASEYIGELSTVRVPLNEAPANQPNNESTDANTEQSPDGSGSAHDATADVNKEAQDGKNEPNEDEDVIINLKSDEETMEDYTIRVASLRGADGNPPPGDNVAGAGAVNQSTFHVTRVYGKPTGNGGAQQPSACNHRLPSHVLLAGERRQRFRLRAHEHGDVFFMRGVEGQDPLHEWRRPPLARPCPPIHVLCLRGYARVTDETLRMLNDAVLPLRVLDVSGTGVTAAAVRRFQEQNPTIRTVHESVCVCEPAYYK